jgi:sugar (pentulose or hexulose) kinase
MTVLDKNNKPIGRAITWMDGRAAAESDTLESLLGNETIYRTCGWSMNPSLDAPKILYMKNRKEYADAALYLSTIEYINLKLTGKAVIDPSNAAIRLLYNTGEGGWDKKILNALGITERELPEIRNTGELAGTLMQNSAAELGLSPGVRVYTGAHDQYCASLGCGAVTPGDMLISTGTAWVLLGITTHPVFSETRIASSRHPEPGLYGNLISLSSIGASYQWIRDCFLQTLQFDTIDAKAAGSVQKSRDLFFVPWLSGSGYPMINISARGGFIGMDFSSDPYCMALAVMESAAFSLKNAVADLNSHGFSPRALKIMGGASNSAVWMDILSAVLDIPLYKTEVADSCALGAAFIAARGEGWYKNYGEAAEKTVRQEKLPPSSLDRDFYGEKILRYNEVISHMQGFYRKKPDRAMAL